MKTSFLHCLLFQVFCGWVVLELAAPLAIAGDSGGARIPGTEYMRKADVIYGRKFGVSLTMDVIVPPKQNGAAVIWVVSSGFQSHHRWIESPQFAKNMGLLLDRGYTIFAVVHGSVPKFTLPEYYRDIRRSIRFIRHHAASYNIDPDRIGISGASAGGVISLMMGAAPEGAQPEAVDPVDRQSDRLQAVACFYPASDLVFFQEDGGNVIPVATRCGHAQTYKFRDFDAKAKVYVPITDQKRINQLLKDYSPITHVTADDPPMMIVHGEADKLVPLFHASRMIDKLNTAGVESQLVVAKGKGHGWKDMWTNEMRQIADWFDKHLAARRQPAAEQK